MTVLSPSTRFCLLSVLLILPLQLVLGQSATLTADATSYAPWGGVVTLTATISYSGQPSALGFTVNLPTGWSYVGGLNEPSIKPEAGTNGTLEWAYTGGFSAGNSSFSFSIAYPPGLTSPQTLSASAVYRTPLASLSITPLVISARYPELSAWQRDNFSDAEMMDSSVSAPTADPDRDGFPNLVEYALGTNPRAGTENGAAVLDLASADWVFTYVRPAARSNITFEPQMSADLVTWTSEGVIHEQIATNGTTATWRARYPRTGSPNLFFRLQVRAN